MKLIQNYLLSPPTATSRFHIPQSQRAGLVLTNGQGYVFERQLLEYFLLLFPCPELVFYLRVDWQRLRRAVVEPVRQRRRSTGEINERTKLDESMTVTDGEEDYVAVPVHRQNCFLGVLPTSRAASTASATPLRRQSCFLRLRQQQQQPPTTLTSSIALRRRTEDQLQQTQAKRMRLQQPLHNMRRSVPPTAASASSHAALLTATATKRSIRI